MRYVKQLKFLKEKLDGLIGIMFLVNIKEMF